MPDSTSRVSRHCWRGRAPGGPPAKLSGYQKFSNQPPPHADAQVFVRALLEAFILDACFWASDWPFLKAPHRLDMGPLIRQVERLLPDPADRRRLWWEKSLISTSISNSAPEVADVVVPVQRPSRDVGVCAWTVQASGLRATARRRLAGGWPMTSARQASGNGKDYGAGPSSIAAL